MDMELISKKELLEATGISYGQLYRWKRKQLIPEEWFIRKSAFTGQETFFPRELILARIDKIVNLKDDLSLDELADKLTGKQAGIEMRKSEFAERNIVSDMVLQRWTGPESGNEIYAFQDMLYLYTVDALLKPGEMSVEEGDALIHMLREHYPAFNGKPCELVFIRRMGIASFALISASAELYFDSGVKIVVRAPLADWSEKLIERLV
ncbi:YhbD family protein [Paenibacillus sp. NPDC057967]|uniref:YhbD family protein n=1 Tax=Paenibacillus sp. NPDC057967 TaxID=3346293 RepID=UPI0036DC585B